MSVQEMEYASLRKIVEERDIATSLKRAGKRAECKICGVSPRVVKGHRAPGHFTETSDAASQCRETRVELGASTLYTTLLRYPLTTPRRNGETLRRSASTLSLSLSVRSAPRCDLAHTSPRSAHTPHTHRDTHAPREAKRLSLSLAAAASSAHPELWLTPPSVSTADSSSLHTPQVFAHGLQLVEGRRTGRRGRAP